MFYTHAHARTHARTHTFNGPFSGTTQVSQYQNGKTNLDFTEARDSEWQYASLHFDPDNHASNPPLSFLQTRCPSCRPTNNMKALKGYPCFILYNISIWDQTHDIHISGLSTYAISTSIGLNLHHTLLQLPTYHHHYQLYSVSAHEAWLLLNVQVTANWKCLHDAAPRYLADLCMPAESVDGRHQSRSAVSGTLLVPWTRTSTGQHIFAAYGSRTWNRLPMALRSPELFLASFKHHSTRLFQH